MLYQIHQTHQRGRRPSFGLTKTQTKFFLWIQSCILTTSCYFYTISNNVLIIILVHQVHHTKLFLLSKHCIRSFFSPSLPFGSPVALYRIRKGRVMIGPFLLLYCHCAPKGRERNERRGRARSLCFLFRFTSNILPNGWDVLIGTHFRHMA